MRGELGIFTPEHAGRGEGRVHFAVPITAGELLGKAFKEGKSLRLAQSPLLIFKVERPDSLVNEFGAVWQYPLHGYPLWHFLNTIAPIPYASDREGLLDDLRMPDTEAGSGRHLAHQRSLGEDWEIFEQSRHIIMDTLDLDPLWQKNRSMWQFRFSFLKMDSNASKNFMLGILNQRAVLAEQLLIFIRNRRELKNRQWISSASLDELIRWADRFQIADFATAFLLDVLSSNDKETKVATIEHLNGLNIQGRKFEQRDGRTFIQIGDVVRGELIVDHSQSGRVRWRMLPETIASTNFFLPTTRWSRDSSGRVSLNFDFFDERVGEELLSHVVSVPDGLQFDTGRFNPLLGFGAIAYDQSVRTDWPEYQKFVKDEEGDYKVVRATKDDRKPLGRGQFMGAQAALIVALQHKEEIAQHEFFARAEEHVAMHAS